MHQQIASLNFHNPIPGNSSHTQLTSTFLHHPDNQQNAKFAANSETREIRKKVFWAVPFSQREKKSKAKS
jgi:hypothetical protein